MKKFFWILSLVLIVTSGCAPTKPYMGAGPDNSDLVRSDVDGRWYHKNPPNARDMMSNGMGQNQD